MVQGQVLLKREGGGWGGLSLLLLFNFFKFHHFYNYKLLYPLQNCVTHLRKNHLFLPP